MSERGSLNGARKIPGIFFKFCEPLEKIRARFAEKKILPKKAHWCAKNKRTFRRTFGIGTTEVQLLDLRGPWHGRQHLEGLLAVNLLAVYAEL